VSALFEQTRHNKLLEEVPVEIIGLDVGTTGCKASLFDEQGLLLGSTGREYSVDFPHPAWAEQDGEAVWIMIQETLRDLVSKTGHSGAAAIGLSVHGEAVTAMDARGNMLRPFILGMDTRTSQQNRQLSQHLGAEALFDWTGMPVHTVNTLPKLLWIRENEPEIWAKAAHFLLIEDFLIYKMTGQFAISRCLASRTQLFDLHRDAWSEPILEYLRLDPARLSPIVPSGTAIAPMQSALSQSLGFSTPPILVTGGHDQACGALGVGLVRPGLAMVSTGTAEVVEVALPSPQLNHSLYTGNISVYAHVVSGLYLAMTLNHSGGLLLRWFRDAFCEAEQARARQTGEDVYNLILSDAVTGPTGLLVLPHFSGSGTPWFDTASRGAILGLTFSTTRADLARAILEGLTCELRINLDLLRDGGVQIDTLRAIGGGAKSDLWLQMKADITGIPVSAPLQTEASTLGAAILAGVGVGIYPSAAQAVEAMLRFRREFQPEPQRQAAYQHQFELYKQVYPAVSPITHQLTL
jgi:xylulokinase